MQFLIRLAGIIGGIVVCSGYAYRVGNKVADVAMKKDDDGATDGMIPRAMKVTSPGGSEGGHEKGWLIP
jgi:hypothetical protein